MGNRLSGKVFLPGKLSGYLTVLRMVHLCDKKKHMFRRSYIVKRISSCIGFLSVVRFFVILIIAATFDHLLSIHGPAFDSSSYFSGSFQSENLSKSINSLESLLNAKVCWFLNSQFSLTG